MEIRIDGKVALVTGAAQGMGLAIAAEMARSGAAGVFATDRNAEGGAREAARIGAGFLAADLAELDAAARIAAACVERFGRIDILVNAAGITDRASLLDATPAEWDRMLAVNARAPFFLMQEAVRQMRAQGTGGAIINILSMNAYCGSPGLATYSAAKGALSTLTKNVANAHRHDRIRVNGINLGWADTPAERMMQGATLGKGEGWLAAAEAAAPFGRLVRPGDVAALALYLASDMAGPMTGALIDLEQWVMGAPK